jgi:iron complex transport system ATP-binding protein
MIEFKNLSIGFHQQKILSNLDGQIQKSQLIALMGINGVGKSCLLKTLTQLNPVVSGELTLDGKKLEDYSAGEAAQKISVVLTDKIQVDYLRVKELVVLGRSPYTNAWGALDIEDNKKIEEVFELLNLAPLKERFFSDLSDGQKQKVLLARALVQEPEYLFLDEPTTYLDIPSKIELMKVLRQLSKEKNIGIFFSTHDLSLVEKTVDQLWLIDNSGVLHKKSPEEMNRSGLLNLNFNLNY